MSYVSVTIYNRIKHLISDLLYAILRHRWFYLIAGFLVRGDPIQKADRIGINRFLPDRAFDEIIGFGKQTGSERYVQYAQQIGENTA